MFIFPPFLFIDEDTQTDDGYGNIEEYEYDNEDNDNDSECWSFVSLFYIWMDDKT